MIFCKILKKEFQEHDEEVHPEGLDERVLVQLHSQKAEQRVPHIHIKIWKFS